mmetsp:Transcript_116739/g.337212  ORF Transcript_116739/g.337212 Transcript_116739/m.337212 type:complete len:244 (+) Transcript_116739:1493-2224(+)
MPQAERREIVDHLVRVAENVSSCPEDLRRDVVEPGVRLLEDVLALLGHLEVAIINFLPHPELLLLVQAFQQGRKRPLVGHGGVQALAQHPLDVVPEPIPRDLMVRVPFLRQQGAQCGKHARLVLAEPNLTFVNLADSKDGDVALFLQPPRVRDIYDHGVEGRDHLAQPPVAAEAHHRCIEVEHRLIGAYHSLREHVGSVPVAPRAGHRVVVCGQRGAGVSLEPLPRTAPDRWPALGDLRVPGR